MNNDASDMTCVGGCGVNAKWVQVTAAINQVVAMTETAVNWGLKFFANGTTGCVVTAGVSVAPAPRNAAAIAAAIAATVPASNTPTTAAELSAGQYLASITDGNPKFILLATDGQPNCGAGSISTSDEAAAILSVQTVRDMGFDTFVVGIATAGTIADAVLDAMAQAGGRPRPASPQYFPVSNTAEVVAALAAIQGMVAPSCTFALRSISPDADLNNVHVTANGGAVTIMSDPLNGWSYGSAMTSLILNGSACAQYLSNGYADLQITFGCL
jgi:hypothetical protein